MKSQKEFKEVSPMLMQEHLGLAINVMEWSHVVGNTSLEEDLVVKFVLISNKCKWLICFLILNRSGNKRKMILPVWRLSQLAMLIS